MYRILFGETAQYFPKFASKAEAKAAGDTMAMEQWISGICSDACWDRGMSRGRYMYLFVSTMFYYGSNYRDERLYITNELGEKTYQYI